MENSSPIVRFGRRFFAILCLALGPVGGYFLLQIYLTARASETWPSVPGEITKAEVGMTPGGRYHADVSYTYAVGGREFTGNRIRASDGEFDSREGAEQAIRGLARGQRVEVHFDPADPTRCLIQPGAGLPEYALLLVPPAMFVIGIAAIRSLLRPRPDSTGTSATGTVDQESGKPPAAPTQPIPVHRAILNAWGDLFRSRESAVIGLYWNSIRDSAPEALAPTTVEEARRRFDAIGPGPATSEAARESLESKGVLTTRIIAGWMVFWTTIGPAGIVGWLFIARIRHVHQLGWREIVSSIFAFVVLFLILCVAGLFVQSLLGRPFRAVLDGILASAGDGPQAPATDDPGNPTGGRPD